MSQSLVFVSSLEPIIFVEPKEKNGCFFSKTPTDYAVYLTSDYKVIPYSSKLGPLSTCAELTSQRIQNYILASVLNDKSSASLFSDLISQKAEMDLKHYFASPQVLKHSELWTIVRAMRAVIREIPETDTLQRSPNWEGK